LKDFNCGNLDKLDLKERFDGKIEDEAMDMSVLDEIS